MPKFQHGVHKQIWDFLVNNPKKDKSDWPGFMAMGHGERRNYRGHAHCPACVYVNKTNTGCGECPLIWPGGVDCYDDSSPYRQWREIRMTDSCVASKLAEQIRDLPVKLNIECE